MKRKNSYSKKKNKKPGRGLTITLLVSAVSMTGLLTWLVMNDWDVEKSMENAQKAIGMSVPADDEKVASENGVLKKEDEKGKQQEEITNQKSTEQTTAPTKTTQSDGTGNTKTVTTTKSASSIDSGGYIKGQVLPKEPKFVNGILLANKKYPLPETYAPGEDKTARAAFETMAAEAKLADFNLMLSVHIAHLNTRQHSMKDMLHVMVKKQQIRTVRARAILNIKQGWHLTLVK